VPDSILMELVIDAHAEVIPAAAHAAECVAVHPNQPCPGYPHETDEES
jgi:hypothetical protein